MVGMESMFVVYSHKMPTLAILKVTPVFYTHTLIDNFGDSLPQGQRQRNKETYRVYHSFKGLESSNNREHMLYGVCNCGQLNKQYNTVDTV